MIDRKARKDTALALRKLVDGKITNLEFEDAIPDTTDPVVWAIFSSIWIFYDDFDEHHLSGKDVLSNEMRSKIDRWILFLLSDLDYKWPKIEHPGVRPLRNGLFNKLLGRAMREKIFMNSGDYSVWPFVASTDYDEVKFALRDHEQERN